MRSTRRLVLLVAALWIGFAASADAQDLGRRHEAALLHHVLQHVRWPDVAFASGDVPIVLAVVGEDPYGELLERALAGRYGGRRVEIRRFAEPGALGPCHALLVPQSLAPEIERVLALVEGLGVLTVGAGDELAERGVMVELDVRGGRLRYALNAAAAEREGLRFSEKLVELAAEVVR